tara:strand:- start:3 stop:269 length:267 start_codon:yes stop_codon:yes gene_type:complete
MKGYVYLIKVNQLQYVGSTTDFSARKLQHKYAFKKGTSRLYQAIRNNDNKYSMYFISIKQYETIKDLRAEEERVRNQLKCELNMMKCC